MITLPNKRLLSVAEEVRQDAIVADIGTDHAYLPIFLLKSGKARFAYLTDINEGPLERARQNAEAAGVSDKTKCILTDGISALSSLPITDFCICGMGGELIADIIGNADFSKNENLRFILQPMSRESTLRAFLLKEGFEIEKEIYSFDTGKHYVAILAKYTGNKKILSRIEAECGLEDVKIVNISCYIDYIRKKIASYEKIIRGKAISGADTSEERCVLAELSKRLGCYGG